MVADATTKEAISSLEDEVEVLRSKLHVRTRTVCFTVFRESVRPIVTHVASSSVPGSPKVVVSFIELLLFYFAVPICKCVVVQAEADEHSHLRREYLDFTSTLVTVRSDFMQTISGMKEEHAEVRSNFVVVTALCVFDVVCATGPGAGMCWAGSSTHDVLSIRFHFAGDSGIEGSIGAGSARQRTGMKFAAWQPKKTPDC